MRVHPQRLLPRQAPVRRESFPGIVVPLGRPAQLVASVGQTFLSADNLWPWRSYLGRFLKRSFRLPAATRFSSGRHAHSRPQGVLKMPCPLAPVVIEGHFRRITQQLCQNLNRTPLAAVPVARQHAMANVWRHEYVENCFRIGSWSQSRVFLMAKNRATPVTFFQGRPVG